MHSIPQSLRIYYEFVINYYEDEQCSSFNNSNTEKDYCNKNEHDTINECCKYIASQKNVILNFCNNSVLYTCGYNKEAGTQAINDIYAGLVILGIIIMFILFIVFCANCSYHINKKNSNKIHYTSLNT
jgi:hypothetical protein